MSMNANLNSTTTSSRLSGKPLILARLAWWGIAILTFVYANVALPYRFIAKPLGYLYETEIILLKQSGISPAFYGIYFNIILYITVFFYLVTGWVIFWRRSDDWMAILVSLTMTTSSLVAFSVGYRLSVEQPAWRFLYILFFMISGIGVEIMFFTFPDGRFIPSWSRWVVAPFAIFALFRGVIIFIDTNLDDVYLYYIWMSLFGASLLAQVYRYRKVSNPTQRQQAKWVIYGLALMILVGISADLPPASLLFPHLSGLSAKFYFFVYLPLITVGPWVAPVLGIGFSILRYRLWDIDFIINRSLVYGALTALLAALFGGSLFIVSQLFQNFTGGPLVAVAVSATVFGAVFQPTRRQIQRFVDRRFYNIQIDYQKTPPDLPPVTGKTEVLRQTHFGAYQDLELIGRGGMADVYKSIHPTLGVPVAIKILPERLAVEAEYRQRFAREAQVVSKLEHPNIVRIFDSGEQDGKYYMVMEYLVGKDLGQMIQKDGRLPLSQTLPLVQQIASALDYAHTNGFVHRDIKPSNVLLEPSSNNIMRAVLTDFGIAKINNAHTVVTVTGYMLGTFDYVAPEQIQESSNVDGRADTYALGVMVYQMLTGELPFKHVNPGALLIAHLNQPPPDACDILADLPHHIGVAIQRAMAKKPEERFATAAGFALEMDKDEI